MARAFLFFLVLLRCLAVSVQGMNITAILQPYPNFSLFNQWLSLTGVANEVNNRTSLTVLATSNAVLQPYLSGLRLQGGMEAVGDTLRYQVLLTYFGVAELRKIPEKNFTSATSLLQTTGRSNSSQGLVDIYNNGTKYLVGHFVGNNYGSKSIVNNITEMPYVYSILQISDVIMPIPTAPAPSPAPTVGVKRMTPTPAPAPGPIARPHAKHGSYGTVTSISIPLMLLAMFLTSSIALL